MKLKWVRLKYFLINFPIRTNFLLLIALIFFAKYWWNNNLTTADDSINNFQPIINLLAKISFFILLIFILIALLSTLIAYLNFNKNKTSIQLNLDVNTTNNISINPVLHKVIRPLLGFVSGRLLLKNKELSKSFVFGLTHYKKNSLFTKALSGKDQLFFPEIKAYEIEGTIIYFEDMFRLLKLPKRIVVTDTFYNPPSVKSLENYQILPHATKEMQKRIEEMQKIEGELLHYKQFEFGDDVRRIVWKIYGKNRALIVRKPEIRNPYASKFEMYASFHFGLKNFLTDSPLAIQLLNTYKNAIWTLYQSFYQQKNWDINYISEQKAANTIDDINEKVAFEIAQSKWQNTQNINDYFNSKTGTIFCIHSLTNIEDLKTFLDNGGENKFIYIAYLSETFNSIKTNWLRKVFFIEKDNTTVNLKTNWLLSPLKNEIEKNENRIDNLLKQYGF